jgi:HAD superfamily hydrolase (TIGR01509 family)
VEPTVIKCVLFDLDGVLVNATEWHYESFNAAVREVCGFELTPLEHEEIFNGLPTREKLRILIEQGRVSEDHVERIFHLKQIHTNRIIRAKCEVDADRVAMVRELSGRHRLACVTNSIRETTELMLRQGGYLPYLEFFLSNEDVTRPKPHPDGFIIGMYRLGARPHEVVIVEDAPKGIAAARASGAHVLEILGYRDLTLARVEAFLEQVGSGDPR